MRNSTKDVEESPKDAPKEKREWKEYHFLDIPLRQSSGERGRERNEKEPIVNDIDIQIDLVSGATKCLVYIE